MKRHRFEFKDGDSFSKPIRRKGDGLVRVEMSAMSRTRGTLQVALLGSADGANWSEIASWQGFCPGWAAFGKVATRYPLLRARLWLEQARLVIAELLLIEAADPAGDSPSERKEDKS